MKMKLTNSKKGVSPLITTILMIAFAVALGVVVMNWGKTTADKIQYECPEEVQISIAQIGQKSQICIDSVNNQFQFTIHNGPKEDISKISLQAITEKDIFKFEANTMLDSNGFEKFMVEYNYAEYGRIHKLTIKPYVKIPDSQNLKACHDSVLELEYDQGLADC